MIARLAAVAFLFGAACAAAAPERLKVGVVQLAQAPTIAASRERIVANIADAAARGARVVVLPEEALNGAGDDDATLVDEAIASIRRTARERNVYVLFGGASVLRGKTRRTHWMRVIGPDGSELLHYDKLHDAPQSPMPGTFEIDGIPCSTLLCADRWLRGLEEIPIQQGARISFELASNSSVEWVAPFGWYWNVPRALRNNVWVVFANTGNSRANMPSYPGASLRHGHSAVIAPDGRIVARSADDVATVVMAEIDVNAATRAEALARAAHPVLHEFWQAGLQRHAGREIRATPLTPYESPVTDITLVAAQVVDDVPAMIARIREARRRQADIIVFPACAASESALATLQAAARENRIVVVFGAEHREGSARYNSAFVLGPDGSLLTRYDQLASEAPFQPGANSGAMWFWVKGVPAVVTIGRDGLWSEISELAAAAGAQLHVHLERDPAGGDAALVREQVWANLASFLTFTATVNVAGSILWDDLRGLEERRAPVGSRLPGSGDVEVYSQFSANVVTRARPDDAMIVATRRVNASNDYHSRFVARKNPQMDAWLPLGAARLQASAGLGAAQLSN
ncbi:MAG TPA: nitrilase-related carbon-nitrogen hydrolase [Opitutaceae bacterium]|nr:nitrilase-related carbon-nitrogen hydrolase [Opitutaceae bacterium]